MNAKSHAIVCASAGLMLLAPAMLRAGSDIFDDSVSTCTGTNCSSLRIPGTVMAWGTTGAANFTINAYASSGQCVRFDLISPASSPSADLELVVIAPNGDVYRNDDRNGTTDRRPLVKIASAPNTGWYTVHIGQYGGSPLNTNFVMLYGLYNGGNPNCATGTTPLAAGFASSAQDADDYYK